MIENSFAEGKVLLIDKPLEWTSYDVIRKLRKIINIKKIGYAGTMDKLNKRIMIVCTGKFTKKINEYMAQEKEYTGAVTLGAVTPTYDRESEPVNKKSLEGITEEMIKEKTKEFTGEILQTPPIHSAIKQNGKPVYLMARKGIDVILEPRKITIKEFEITRIDLPVISFKVVCTTGTYIRSLANDFGLALGCGGYLSELRRTRIGNFKVEDAMTMDEFKAQFQII